jgi:hypothetical protein
MVLMFAGMDEPTLATCFNVHPAGVSMNQSTGANHHGFSGGATLPGA